MGPRRRGRDRAGLGRLGGVLGRQQLVEWPREPRVGDRPRVRCCGPGWSNRACNMGRRSSIATMSTGTHTRTSASASPTRGTAAARRSGLRKLTAKYPVGGPCTVYYNPANPATSCLEPGVNYLLLIVGVPLVLGLLAAAVGTIRYGLWELRHGPTPITTYISRPLRPPGNRPLRRGRRRAPRRQTRTLRADQRGRQTGLSSVAAGGRDPIPIDLQLHGAAMESTVNRTARSAGAGGNLYFLVGFLATIFLGVGIIVVRKNGNWTPFCIFSGSSSRSC